MQQAYGTAPDAEGNIWEVDENGNPIRMVQAAQRPQQPRPRVIMDDPNRQREQDVNINRTQTQTQGQILDNQFDAATLEARRRQAEAEARAAEIAAAEAERTFEKTSAPQMEPDKRAELAALDAQLQRLRVLYEQGPGSTSGIGGIADYNPFSVSNQAFDAAAAGMGQIGLAAFRKPGQGSQSDFEAQAFMEANQPSAAAPDAKILERIDNVQRRLDETLRAYGMTVDDLRPSALEVTRTDGGRGPETTVDYNAESTTIAPPPAMVRKHDDLVAAIAFNNEGRIPPDVYAAMRVQLDKEFDRQGDPESYKSWATSVNDYLDAGGKTIPTGILPEERVLDRTDTLRNKAAVLGGATGVAGFANAVGAGGLEALAPDQMAAIADAYPMANLGGEVVGATLGTGMVGRLGREALKGAPRFVSNQVANRTNQFGRTLATDATYGGIYGTTTEGDPLTGAALGAGGSAVGQALGRGLSAGIGGVARTQPAQALRDAGVRLTVGRSMGGLPGRFEDAVESIPVVGDMVRNRQLDSFQDFNEAVFREAAGQNAGPQINIGQEGLDDLSDIYGAQYRKAIGDQPARLDSQFYADLRPARDMARNLNENTAAAGKDALTDAVQLPPSARAVTGEQFQNAMKNLGRTRNRADTILPNASNTLRNAATQVMDALEGSARRAGRADNIAALEDANRTYRLTGVLDDAVNDKALGGTASGEIGTFTPNQLQRAARQNEKKFGGDRPFRAIADAGQEVLPSSLPNSGTTDRAIVAGLLGTGALTGAGGTALGYDEESLAAGGLLGAMALLGTRGGQQALDDILFERPELARRLGRSVGMRTGLFGGAGAGLALQGQ